MIYLLFTHAYYLSMSSGDDSFYDDSLGTSSDDDPYDSSESADQARNAMIQQMDRPLDDGVTQDTGQFTGFRPESKEWYEYQIVIQQNEYDTRKTNFRNTNSRVIWLQQSYFDLLDEYATKAAEIFKKDENIPGLISVWVQSNKDLMNAKVEINQHKETIENQRQYIEQFDIFNLPSKLISEETKNRNLITRINDINALLEHLQGKYSELSTKLKQIKSGDATLKAEEIIRSFTTLNNECYTKKREIENLKKVIQRQKRSINIRHEEIGGKETKLRF